MSRSSGHGQGDWSKKRVCVPIRRSSTFDWKAMLLRLIMRIVRSWYRMLQHHQWSIRDKLDNSGLMSNNVQENETRLAVKLLSSNRLYMYDFE